MGFWRASIVKPTLSTKYGVNISHLSDSCVTDVELIQSPYILSKKVRYIGSGQVILLLKLVSLPKLIVFRIGNCSFTADSIKTMKKRPLPPLIVFQIHSQRLFRFDAAFKDLSHFMTLDSDEAIKCNFMDFYETYTFLHLNHLAKLFCPTSASPRPMKIK
jgi:hypothetical protein